LEFFMASFPFRFGLLLAAPLLTLTLSGCEGVSSLGESLSQIKLPSLSSSTKPEETQEPPAGATTKSSLAPILAEAGPECPQVKVLGDVSRLAQYANPDKPSPADLITETFLNNITASCKIGSNSVTLDLTLDFAGKLGPQGIKDTVVEANYSYPYFLTVVDPSGAIIAKDVFAISLTYRKGETETTKQDQLRQTIPLPAGSNANQFQVIAGFQLSEEELQYNRLASPGTAP
jgi:hypothetical protein